ncbi:MAG TPA: hypothetical protein VN758_09005 [Solirubrobacterales bacterium]|nr:hypothetical protein [Solirubrobacterales bacterium]
MARKGNPDRVEGADVEIGASVKAKQLRFRQKPKTRVELHGELREPDGHGELQTASGSERQNLPDEVEPGVTYRDVRVRWRAAARLGEPSSSEGAEGREQDRKRNSSRRSQG